MADDAKQFDPYWGMTREEFQTMEFFDAIAFAYEHGGFRKLCVDRYDEDLRAFGRVDDVEGPPLSFDEFRESFGVGKYRLQAIRMGLPHGTLRQTEFTVSPRATPQRDQLQPQRLPRSVPVDLSAPTPLTHNDSQELAELRARLDSSERRAREAEERSRSDIAARAAEEKQRKEDERFQSLERAIAKLADANAQPREAQQPVDKELLGFFSKHLQDAYSHLGKASEKQAEPKTVSSQIEEMKIVMELAKSLSPEEVRSMDWNRLFEGVGSGIARLAPALMALASKEAPAQPAQPAQQQLAHDAQSEEGADDEEGEFVRADRIFLEALVESFGARSEREAMRFAFAKVRSEMGDEYAAEVAEYWEPYLELEYSIPENEKKLRKFIMKSVPLLDRPIAATQFGKANVRTFVLGVVRELRWMIDGLAEGDAQATAVYKEALAV